MPADSIERQMQRVRVGIRLPARLAAEIGHSLDCAQRARGKGHDAALGGRAWVLDAKQVQCSEPIDAVEQIEREWALGTVGRFSIILPIDDWLLQTVFLDIGSELFELGLRYLWASIRRMHRRILPFLT